ncbi:hypothetical protein HFO56_03315 [Rhizobium laguerreae]|uniref:hypothetical protein n=1 Tax=Rhizobium laguerreae TaxID=1076926 RepID=UPI001C922253|nr:hypothetical protein [Rhizobium laguerreae]MBY3151417.1 hypothetical protein [Rhizobium laguerreae]
MAHEQPDEVSEESLKKGLEGIFSAILGDESRKAREALSAHENNPEVLEATEALKVLDYRKFRSSLLRRHEQLTRALVEKVLGDNHHLFFLLTKQDFVGRHIQNLFVDIEGSSCCADKERTVMRALIRHYHKGARIEFNYDAEYTYMLPQVVLRDQESIIGYFDSLYRLYYGNPKPYLAEMLKIAQQAQAARAAAIDAG